MVLGSLRSYPYGGTFLNSSPSFSLFDTHYGRFDDVSSIISSRRIDGPWVYVTGRSRGVE